MPPVFPRPEDLLLSLLPHTWVGLRPLEALNTEKIMQGASPYGIPNQILFSKVVAFPSELKTKFLN